MAKMPSITSGDPGGELIDIGVLSENLMDIEPMSLSRQNKSASFLYGSSPRLTGYEYGQSIQNAILGARSVTDAIRGKQRAYVVQKSGIFELHKDVFLEFGP